MTAKFEIIEGKSKIIKGLKNIVQLMYDEGIETKIIDDGRKIIVFDNGTYEIEK